MESLEVNKVHNSVTEAKVHILLAKYSSSTSESCLVKFVLEIKDWSICFCKYLCIQKYFLTVFNV